MQSAPVVVVQASPPERSCFSCQAVLKDFLAFQVCPQCGAPQALQATEDYYSVFDLPKVFGLDRALLEKRFYEISRALHPDRFTQASVAVKMNSLERMGFVNQAYTVLKSPARSREYLLGISGVEAQKKGQIPLELAEAWFEIQDLLSDGNAKALTKLEVFHKELQSVQQDLENRLQSLERDYDSLPSQEVLLKMGQQVQQQAYLKSMERDVERIKKNAQ